MSPVLVKLCGLNTREGVEAALAAGADALGFVLAPSPRRVTLAEAERLLARVPATVEAVAVFARPTLDELRRALELPFAALQVEAGTELPALPPDRFCLPVLRDRPELDELVLPVLPAGSHRSLCGAFVLDGPHGGGQGVPADPGRATRLARRVRLVLAGGLTPENVAERIRAVRPFAVDASSGLERTRGIKDTDRIEAFVRAVRAAEAELHVSHDLPTP